VNKIGIIEHGKLLAAGDYRESSILRQTREIRLMVVDGADAAHKPSPHPRLVASTVRQRIPIRHKPGQTELAAIHEALFRATSKSFSS
jgi:hypothetical protein